MVHTRPMCIYIIYIYIHNYIYIYNYKYIYILQFMNINKVYKTTHSWGHPVAFNFQTSLQNKSSRWGNCKSSYPGFCYIKMCLKIECIPSYSLNVSAYFFFEIDDSPVVSENSAVPYLQAPANPSGGYFANDFARWFWQEWLRRLLLFWGESITRWRMMEGIYDSMMEYIILYHWNSLESFAKLMHVFHKMQLVEFTTKNGSCLAQIPKSQQNPKPTMKHPMPPRSTDLWQSLLSPVGQGVKPPHSTWNCIHGNLAQYARHVSDRTGSAGFVFFLFCASWNTSSSWI